MIARCTNPKHPKYPRYGGRGILVCERWRKFVNFLEDLKEAPHGLSIDRIDNDKGYEPGNIRWSTRTEQQVNRAAVHLVEWRGQTLALKQWARKLGISYTVIEYRINRGGWTTEEAFTTPVKVIRR